MADPFPDDASEASSGDEMLNMVVPFSQESATAISASPERSVGKDKGLDNEDEDGGGKKSNTIGKKRKHEEISDENDDADMEEKARKNATKAFDETFHDSKIGNLYWYEGTKKGNKELHPVRVVTSEEETLGLALYVRDETRERRIQYIEYPHVQIRGDVCEYKVVSKNTLCHYYGEGDDRDKWCATRFKKYSTQLKKKHKGLKAVDIKTEELFLHCALQKSLEESEQEQKLRAQIDNPLPEEIVINEDEVHVESDSKKDEVEEETGGSRMLTRGNVTGKETHEQLRVGDIIEYYTQQGVAGDSRNLCEAEILYIDPKADSPLMINDEFTFLEPTHMVKRIKKRHRGKIVEIKGEYREINKYDLKKEGDPNAHKKFVTKLKADRAEKLQRLKDQKVAEMEKDGLGQFKDFIR